MFRLFTLVLILLGSFSLAAKAGIYRFQPGDQIQVSVWQEPKLDRQIAVAPDGSVSLPLVGRVVAGGRSAGQIAASIKGRLSQTYKGELDVTVSFVSRPEIEPAEKIDPRIYVMGEVKKPGEFIIKVRTTVLQALALGGGLSPFAADRRIQVHRKIKGEDIVYQFNYRDFQHGGEPGSNIRLRPGDVVVVPERGLFE